MLQDTTVIKIKSNLKKKRAGLLKLLSPKERRSLERT